MAWDVIAVALAAVAMPAALGLLGGFWQRRRLRKLLAGPPQPIARVRGGLVAIEGRASALDSRRSPLSEQQVLGYELAFHAPVDADQPAGKQLLALTEIPAFELRDDSGRAEVRPGAGEVLLWRFDTPAELSAASDDLPPALERLLRGHPQRRLLGRHPLLVVTETVIRDGDRLLVVGRAHREPDPRGPAAGYREPPTIPVLTPPGKRPLVITEVRRADPG
jgi:hypothetical protein